MKHAKGGGGHALLLQEFFGKGFTAFELGRSPVRAKHAQTPRLKQIDDPETQRQLRTDNRQPYPFFFRKRAQPIDVIRGQRNRLGVICNPGVARRTVDF